MRPLPVLDVEGVAPSSAISPLADASSDDGGPDRSTRTEDQLRRALSKRMLSTCVRHQLIEDGDRILVAISGGKDSYTLLDLLWRARQRAPVSFELIAFHLDQRQPDYDGSELRRWLEEFGAPFRIHSEDTYSIVKEQVADSGKAYCAPCSRLRRGILYTWAEKLDCNKIALGHHADDALETLFLNLFYSGRLQAMPAGFETNDGRFRVIRPLVECAEETIAEYAKRREFPILPCNLCGSQEGLRRQRVAEWISDLETEIPDVRRVMLAALGNVRPTHLLDREVAEAWNDAASRYATRR